MVDFTFFLAQLTLLNYDRLLQQITQSQPPSPCSLTHSLIGWQTRSQLCWQFPQPVTQLETVLAAVAVEQLEASSNYYCRLCSCSSCSKQQSSRCKSKLLQKLWLPSSPSQPLPDGSSCDCRWPTTELATSFSSYLASSYARQGGKREKPEPIQ